MRAWRGVGTAATVCLAVGAAHAALELTRLLFRHGQGWGAGELAPAVFFEGLLALPLGLPAVLLLLWRPRRRLAAAAWVVGTVLLLQGAARWTVPAEPGGAIPAPDGGGRTLVLLTLDTLRRDHVSAYPEVVAPDLTPELEALAREGMLYLDAVTTSPLTLPSHTTLLSGQAPWEHGVLRNGRAVPADLDAVPLALAAEGWSTAAFTSSRVLHGSHGMRRWFHVYRDALGLSPGSTHLTLTRALRRGVGELFGLGRDRLGKEPGDRTVGRTLRWLGRQPRDASVFVWVHLYDAHAPYVAHPDLPVGATALGHPCDWSDHPAAIYRAGPRPFLPPRPPLRERRRCRSEDWSELQEQTRAYASEVRFLDQQVGRLVDGLRAMQRWDDTGMVVVGDHGESLVEHQQHASHQYALYDPVARVPLLVRSPAHCLRCPGVVATQVSTARVASTLRLLGDLPPDPATGGPHLLDDGDPMGFVVGPAPWSGDPSEDPTGVQVAARTSAAKVVVTDRGHVERYDLVADPFEQRPLLSPGEQGRLRATLRGRLSGADAPRRALLAPPPSEVSPAVRQAFEQPGVLGIEAPPAVLGPFGTVEARAREILVTLAESGSDAGGTPLPPEVRESLEALGYLQ